MTREEWLSERRNHIGASEVAAILGADQRRGQLAVYASKVLGDESPDNEWMKWGRDVEDAIGKGYAHQTGRPVRDLGATAIQYHSDLPWLGATLDRETEGTDNEPAPYDGPGPLELKAVSAFMTRADDWKAEPPINYQIQLQIQMACLGSRWGALCGLIGGIQLVYADFERDDGFLNAAYPVLDEFWNRVKRKDPPEADNNPGTLEVVKRVWNNESGETVPLDGRAMDLATQWELEKGLRREADKKAKGLEGQLRALIKDATFGALPDGTFLSLKTTKRKGYTVAPTEYRTLRRFRPKK